MKLIFLNKIEIDFGKNNERKDCKLLGLLNSCHKKELTCRKALIKSDFIKPFTDYKPILNEKLKKYFTENFKKKNYSELMVYQEGNKFIMSDDYYAYYFYKEKNCENIPCLVIGEIKGEEGVYEITSEPFYLKEEPTCEVI